jgi:Rha family phage regulatory protein
MNQLTQTLTSNEVAEMIGTTNGELMKSIRTYIGYLAEGEIPSGDFFIDSTYKDSNNQERPNYLLTKQGCEMVSNKLTGPKGVQFTAKYVSRFNQMEKHIKLKP